MTISLLDGRQVQSEDLQFNPQFYHFYLHNADLTDLITRADKRAIVPDFDDERENERIYVESYYRKHGKLPPEVGSDSVWDNFLKNVAAEPLPSQWLTLGWLVIGFLIWRELRR